MKKIILCFICTAQLLAIKCSDPTILSSIEHPASDVRVGINERGDAVAVWIAKYGYEYAAQAAIKLSGGQWSESAQISNMEADIGAPRCVIDSRGNISVSWLYDRGDIENIFQVVQKTEDEHWSQPNDIKKEDQFTNLDKSLFTSKRKFVTIGRKVYGNGVGKRIIAGVQLPQGKIRYTHLASAKACCGAFHNVHLTANARGTVLALWQRETPEGHYVLEYAWQREGTSWTAPEQIPTIMNIRYDALEVALDFKGSINLVWQENEKIYAACTCHGVWSQPIEITEPEEKGSHSKVAIDDEGNVLVIWQSHREKNGKIQTNYRAVYKPVGDAWSARTELCEPTDFWNAVDVKADHTGRFFLTWQENNVIYGASFSTMNQTWSTIERLSPMNHTCRDYSVDFSSRGIGDRFEGFFFLPFLIYLITAPNNHYPILHIDSDLHFERENCICNRNFLRRRPRLSSALPSSFIDRFKLEPTPERYVRASPQTEDRAFGVHA